MNNFPIIVVTAIVFFFIGFMTSLFWMYKYFPEVYQLLRQEVFKEDNHHE